MNEEFVKQALDPVMDPELGASLVELGLVGEIQFSDDRLTLNIGTTSPSCPMGQYLVDASEEALQKHFPDLAKIEVFLAWDPEWSPARMSPALRERFGWSGEE
jgi:metal-sulfur cluster biosynthetic enzyme